MLDATDERLLRYLNEAGRASYRPSEIAPALGLPLLDAYRRTQALAASGYLVRMSGEGLNSYALTYLGLEVATAA